MSESLIVPPPSARLHLLSKIRVVLDQDWHKAVGDAASVTIEDFCLIYKAEALYPPTGKGELVRDYIALNFNWLAGWQVALDWAKQQGLENTAPREAFAVGNQCPNLNHILGKHQTYLVATTCCTFVGKQQACCVYWTGTMHEPILRPTDSFKFCGSWFLFRKPSVLVA